MNRLRTISFTNNTASANDWIDIRDKHDYRLSFIVCFLMISLFIINSVNVMESKIGLPFDIVSNAAKIILLLLIVFNLNSILKNISIKTILFVFFSIIVILLNYLLASDNAYFVSTIEAYLLNVFPVFVIASCIHDSDILLKTLTKASWIIVILSLFIVLFARGAGGSNYYMGFSNALSIPVILVMYDYYVSKSKMKLITAMVGVVVIVVMGSRGALLGIGVYAMVLLCRGLLTKEHRVISATLIAIILSVLILYKPILNLTVKILENMDIYSRTIHLILYDAQTNDSGRNTIYQPIINEINSHPFRIRGIAGEYAITNGAYAHNFVLELLCDFGIVIGGAVVIYIFWHVLKTLYGSIFSKDPDAYMIFMAASIPLMLVSGSLWTSTYFWIWIALIVNKKIHTKRL